MIKFLFFIAFIGIYILYIWTTIILLIKYVFQIKENKFIQNELLIILPNIFLFAFLFTIGRFFNLYLVLISILFSNLGLLLSYIFWNLLGNPKVPSKAIGGWAGYNFGIKNVWFNLVLQILSFLILIVYPVVVGIHYFGNFSLDEIRLFTLQSTIILILSAYLLMIPIIVNVLSSDFIDEDSRARYLITQFSNLIPNFLFISLLFWTFNISEPSRQISLGNISISFDPLIFTLLMSFFILFFLLPYFIGIQRARQLRSEYADIRNAVLEGIIEAIDLATPKTINARIEDLEQLLHTRFDELVGGDKVIKLGLDFDDPAPRKNLAKQDIFIFNLYKEARPFDKRFVYYDFLNNTYKNVLELKNALLPGQSPDDYRETIKTFSAHFKDVKKEINEINDRKTKSSPALWIGIIGIASPVISQVLTEIGKHLIEYFKKL